MNIKTIKNILETCLAQLTHDHPEYQEEGTTGNDLLAAIQNQIAEIDKILKK
jgi:hypothetical protein